MPTAIHPSMPPARNSIMTARTNRVLPRVGNRAVKKALSFAEGFAGAAMYKQCLYYLPLDSVTLKFVHSYSYDGVATTATQRMRYGAVRDLKTNALSDV